MRAGESAASLRCRPDGSRKLSSLQPGGDPGPGVKTGVSRVDGPNPQFFKRAIFYRVSMKDDPAHSGLSRPPEHTAHRQVHRHQPGTVREALAGEGLNGRAAKRRGGLPRFSTGFQSPGRTACTVQPTTRVLLARPDVHDGVPNQARRHMVPSP